MPLLDDFLSKSSSDDKVHSISELWTAILPKKTLVLHYILIISEITKSRMSKQKKRRKILKTYISVARLGAGYIVVSKTKQRLLIQSLERRGSHFTAHSEPGICLELLGGNLLLHGRRYYGS